jgi:hypothetical protein
MSGKIDHVVIIVKENHTFDNYFGTFPGADGATLDAAQNPPPDDPNVKFRVADRRRSSMPGRSASVATNTLVSISARLRPGVPPLTDRDRLAAQ